MASSSGPRTSSRSEPRVVESLDQLCGRWRLVERAGAHEYRKARGVGSLLRALTARDRLDVRIDRRLDEWTVVTRLKGRGRPAVWTRLTLVADDETAVESAPEGTVWFSRHSQDVLVAEAHRADGASMVRRWVEDGRLHQETTDATSGAMMLQVFDRIG